MNQPTVCCVMLTADRPALVKRAVECFQAQTYPAKRLLIWDTGDELADVREMKGIEHRLVLPERDIEARDYTRSTIGELRNKANSSASVRVTEPDIYIHWDDDDWSHPNRITEQVALMESTGADVCGYNQMLFWRETRRICSDRSHDISGEAWLYTGSILGTSLCYRRSVWERFPFPDTSYGEDTDWLKRVQHAKLRVAAETSLVVSDEFTGTADDGIAVPRTIARIHAANTSKAYAPKAMQEAPHHWSRVHEWDDLCRSLME